jgi:2-polyprenyl-3-methyl-5-hydroxy-6-metoxy-1,4-benzoquinol methylase
MTGGADKRARSSSPGDRSKIRGPRRRRRLRSFGDPELGATSVLAPCYTARHRHSGLEELPTILSQLEPVDVLADIGCGDGAFLAALHNRGLFRRGLAIDVSAERVQRACERCPGAEGIVSEATRLGLERGSVDAAICSQVIEHVENDDAVAREIARVLRPGGWFYVGSVLRSKRAWWIYRHSGRSWLDPTHVREYESVEKFRSVIERHLSIETVIVRPFRYPILDLLARALTYAGLLDGDQFATLYDRRPWLKRVRGLAITPPGYSVIEAVGRKV